MSRSQKKSFNPWKYAFLIVMALLVLGLAFLAFQIFHSDMKTNWNESQPTTRVEQQQAIFQVHLTKKQTQRLANHYIKEFLNNDDIKYHLTVEKNQVNLLGSAIFLGSHINFILQTKPYATANGGIQLKAQRLKVGKLGIPLEFIMFYIQHNYHFPKWVQINSKQRLININLPAHHSKQGYYFKVDQLNLPQDRIIIKVFSTAM